MATHSNILDWRISQTEEPGGLQPMESERADILSRQRNDWSLLQDASRYLEQFDPLCITFKICFMRPDPYLLYADFCYWDKLLLSTLANVQWVVGSFGLASERSHYPPYVSISSVSFNPFGLPQPWASLLGSVCWSVLSWILEKFPLYIQSMLSEQHSSRRFSVLPMLVLLVTQNFQFNLNILLGSPCLHYDQEIHQSHWTAVGLSWYFCFSGITLNQWLMLVSLK